VVPEGKLFTMGDNRDDSNDSRFWGFVDVSAVRGKAFMIYWSWNSEDIGVRWDRAGEFDSVICRRAGARRLGGNIGARCR
jgi:signal peptidase I